MAEEKLTPEEKEAADTLEKCLKNRVQKIIDPIFSVMDWCWPATMAMLIIKFVGYSTGYYYVPMSIVSVFLWAPIVLVFFISALIIGSFYLFGLFMAWHKFFSNVLFILKLGFLAGKNKADSEKEDNEDESL